MMPSLDYEETYQLCNKLRDVSNQITSTARSIKNLSNENDAEPLILYVLLKQIEAQCNVVTDILWPYVRDLVDEQ